jgi:hypothetical protein
MGKTGKGRERGQGRGSGKGRGRGKGQGRMGGSQAAGPGGYCTCPDCGEKIKHIIGKPCFEQKCPKCGAFMVRE